MSDLLWQKPGVTVDARIQAFLAGDDVVLDREFFLHDIAASAAHAEGLQHIGILGADELAGLQRELEVLADDFRAGRFVLDEQYEDGHSAIEARLTDRLGDAGARCAFRARAGPGGYAFSHRRRLGRSARRQPQGAVLPDAGLRETSCRHRHPRQRQPNQCVGVPL